MERRKPLSAIISEGRAELRSAPAFDDITDVTERLEGVVQEIRKRQDSGTEIHVHAAPPVTVDKHDSTPVELKLAWKHRGLFVKALPWIAALGLGAGAERVLRFVGLIH